MNHKQKKILEAIFKKPTPTNIAWHDIENLFKALGSEISEGSGSRLRVKLNGVRAVFHRPHPSPYTDRGAVLSVKRFLQNAGVAS
ncbi:MAG: type II toxin-antitoxin system HicA family toxin [Nitrospirota bacterium]